MKFTIKTSILNELISTAQKATSQKVLIPILTGILFELDDKSLTLTASDSNLIIKTSTIDRSLIVHETGKIVVGAKLISDIVRKIDDEFIHIEKIDDSLIFIHTERVEFHINDFNINEFPLITINKEENTLSLPSFELKNLITNTLFSVAIQENRPQLTGINVVNTGENLIFTATDTYRLSQVKYKLENNFDFKSIIIPSRSAQELLKMLKDDDTPIQLSITNMKLTIEFVNTIFQTKLLDGNYPDVFTLIPKVFEKKIKLNKNDFIHTLDRTSLLVSENSNKIVNMKLIDGNTLEFTSMTQEVGKVKEIMSILENSQIDELKIAYNARYVIECLRVFSTNTIDIYYYGELKPLIIKQSDSENLIQMILPVKTYWGIYEKITI